jgi:hypothetical protein
MKTRSLCLGFLIFALGLPAFSQSKPDQNRIYFKPSGPVGNFTLLVPAKWKTTSTIKDTEESYTFSLDKGTIRVRAFFSDADIMNLLRLKKWEIADIDPSFKPIISNEKIIVRKSIEGKLLVYEFRDHKQATPLIQRTFITTHGSYVYIIDCRAPSTLFYKYDNDFTAAMGSFALTGEPEKNKVPVKKAEIPAQTKPEQHADIKPEQVRKDAIHIDNDELSKIGLTEENASEKKEQKVEPETEQEKTPADIKEQDAPEKTENKVEDVTPAK